ncbi:cation channel family protein (macronuclear) [Tetrahymena thermophila SB210]|uniref:Cation channel family protein n=1 Tax=Tetrahymena thermophila (strain SB210) TaxID=312017 RepID=Q22U33_TETTS|nr:cation channel family protein [Tetrahymena thermophila SB210]EAR88854.2 cation channel family protein [Tetrahymena thermophila SB210]|eukprot:XP_001009099.2 cation channel family protein [Tetrahymena thermophila SB210]
MKGKYLFTQDSFWRFFWDILMIFFVLYLIIVIPLSHVFGDNYGVFTSFHQTFIKWMLVLEIFINLNSEIYSNGVTIKDRYTIFKKNNWKIMIDLLLYVLFLYSIYYKDLKHKISYLDFLLFIKYREIPSKLSELEIKFQISDSFKNWLKLLKLELSVLILAHVACCIFLLIGQFERDNNKDNWIDKYNYSNYTVIELYLTSFYFIIISICTVGYGDIAPCTIIEREFIILVALISTNITAYSFSQISEIVKFEDSKKESFNKVMVGINFQMKLNSLGMNLQQKVRKYFEYLHDSDLQRSHIQESLLDRLPNHLKEEVLLEMNKQFISSIQIFKGFSPQCLKMISLSIKQKQLLPDQIAIQEKEYNDSLYFISQGTLQILCSVSQKQDETMFEKGITMLKKQDSFGYEGFLYGENCPYSIKSVQQSVISYLEKEQFLQIIKHFPTDYEKFCYIRDKQIYDSFQKVVYRLKCISCQEQDHYPNHCQFINPTIKYKNDKSVNMRSFCHRIKTRNTNILKNNKYYQDIAITLAYMRDDTLTAQQDTINDNSSNDQSYISDDLQSGDKLNQIIKRNNGQEASRKSKDILQVDFVLEDNANLKPKSLNELNTKNQQFIVLNINSNENNNNINKNDQDMDSNQIQKQASSASFTQSIKSLALSDLSDMNKAKSREDNLSDKGKQQESDKAAFNNNHHDFQLFQNNNLSVNIDDNISSKQINSGQQNATKIENAKQKLSKKVNQKFSKSLFSQQLSNNLEPQIEENLNVNQETENNKIITIKQKSLNIIDLKQEDSQTFRKRSNSEIQQENISISKFLKPQPKAQKAKVSDKGKNQTFSNINSLIQSANLINKRAHILNENKIKYQLSQPKEIEDNQLDSNEFQIRFMLNLQNLDMLVVRKEYLLMQQKNQITDYIQVPDNEIDIDVLHNYKYYYFNGNFKQVLQRMKTRDDKNKDVLSSPHKKKSNGSRKNQRKTHRYKPTSFNSKKKPQLNQLFQL